MTPEERVWFDDHVDAVMATMPPLVHELIEQVPLHVEDHPSRDVLDKTGHSDPWVLCGLYTGVPITERHVESSGELPSVVTIYREGILQTAADRRGHVHPRELRRQIRITILHELAHYHGLDEDQLEALGYG